MFCSYFVNMPFNEIYIYIYIYNTYMKYYMLLCVSTFKRIHHLVFLNRPCFGWLIDHSKTD